jgi:hypothetical protein
MLPAARTSDPAATDVDLVRHPDRSVRPQHGAGRGTALPGTAAAPHGRLRPRGLARQRRPLRALPPARAVGDPADLARRHVSPRHCPYATGAAHSSRSWSAAHRQSSSPSSPSLSYCGKGCVDVDGTSKNGGAQPAHAATALRVFTLVGSSARALAARTTPAAVRGLTERRSGMELIELHHISKSYGRVAAVQDLSLTQVFPWSAGRGDVCLRIPRWDAPAAAAGHPADSGRRTGMCHANER